MEQNSTEFEAMCKQLLGCSSFLEIGSRGGATLWQFAFRAMLKGSKVYSIDIEPSDGLDHAIACLRDKGFHAENLTASSQSITALEWAEARSPFDFLFIDGDHDYEPVKQDWERYGPLASVVGLHDIANPEHGVQRLWREIKATTVFRTWEISLVPDLYGIGLVFRREFVNGNV